MKAIQSGLFVLLILVSLAPLMSLVPTAHAENYVVINSDDGRDVLSGVFYANVKGLPVKFVPSQGGDANILAAQIGGGKDILLIQSKNTPLSTFVESALRNKGNAVSVFSSEHGLTTNLEMAKRSGATSFIIVDSAFAHDAISALPYAAKTKSYIILTNRDNVASVKEVVRGKKVIIYGGVEDSVRKTLADLNPTTIGNGEDKFVDNTAMIDKYLSEYPTNTVIVTDGSTLEDSIIAGTLPVMLSGTLMPEPTYQFLKAKVGSGTITSTMIIGRELVMPLYDVRERMKVEFAAAGMNKTFGITAKFGQVIPSAGSGVVALDTFRVPAYLPKLSISEIVYNKQTGRIMVGFENKGEGQVYYEVETRVRLDGVDRQVFGANATKVLEIGQTGGEEYTFSLAGIPAGNLSVLTTIKYGSGKKSLEAYVTKEGPLAQIEYMDQSNVSVQRAQYDKEKQSVMVTLRNNGAVPAYVFTSIGLLVGGSPTNISGSGTRMIGPGAMVVETFPLGLDSSDMASNKNISVYVDYGGRIGFLNKKVLHVLPLEGGETQLPIFLILTGIVIVAMVAFALWRKMQNGQQDKKG